MSEELSREEKAPERTNRTRAFFLFSLTFFCLGIRHGLNTPHLLQTVDFVRLLHRRTAPPDEGEACLSNWQTDRRTQEVYDWTVPEQPTLVLREYNIEVGGIFRLVSRGEACDAKPSGELKVESVCIRLPPDLDRQPTTSLHFFWFSGQR